MFRSSAIVAGIGIETRDGGSPIPASIDNLNCVKSVSHCDSEEAPAPPRACTSSQMKPSGLLDRTTPRLAETAIPAIQSAAQRGTAEQKAVQQSVPIDCTTAAAEYSRPIWSGRTSAVAELRVVTTNADPREISTKPMIYRPRAAAIATKTKPMIDKTPLTWDIRRSLTVGAMHKALASNPDKASMRKANVRRVTTPRRARKRLA